MDKKQKDFRAKTLKWAFIIFLMSLIMFLQCSAINLLNIPCEEKVIINLLSSIFTVLFMFFGYWLYERC